MSVVKSSSTIFCKGGVHVLSSRLLSSIPFPSTSVQHICLSGRPAGCQLISRPWASAYTISHRKYVRITTASPFRRGRGRFYFVFMCRWPSYRIQVGQPGQGSTCQRHREHLGPEQSPKEICPTKVRTRPWRGPRSQDQTHLQTPSGLGPSHPRRGRCGVGSTSHRRPHSSLAGRSWLHF